MLNSPKKGVKNPSIHKKFQKREKRHRRFVLRTCGAVLCSCFAEKVGFSILVHKIQAQAHQMQGLFVGLEFLPGHSLDDL